MFGQLSLAGRRSGKIIRPQEFFRTTLWNSNGGEGQICRTGFDMFKRSGLIWDTSRNRTFGHDLFDTVHGAQLSLASESTGAQTYDSYRSFRNDGFVGRYNSNDFRVAWTFLEGERFFKIVTWRGDGASSRVIPHGLGIKPGMIVVKARSTTSSWITYHRSLGAASALALDTTQAAFAYNAGFNSTEPTDTNFTVGSALNGGGVTFVAYVFAHDPDTTNGIVQCGSSVETSSGQASFTVPTGWSNGSQWLIYKIVSGGGSPWYMLDTARSPDWTDDRFLQAQSSQEELATTLVSQSGSTLTVTDNTAGATVVWMVIRAPY